MARAPFVFVLGIVILVGTYWSFSKGGQDFSVFYEAWKHVLNGRSELIYRVSPDRFLYAPFFAYLFSPIAFASLNIALSLWCLAKAWMIGMTVKSASRFYGLNVNQTCIAFLIVSKPLLIDLQYGQVNLFVVCITLITLMERLRVQQKPWQSVLWWALTTVLAFSKLFTLPVLLVPSFFSDFLSPQRRRREIQAVLVASAVICFTPFLFGFDHGIYLYQEWLAALQSRGFPLESHNQSFMAFLHHILGSEPTPVLALGLKGMPFGLGILSQETIQKLGIAWILATSSLILAWILTLKVRAPQLGVSLLVALFILPSHLVWKPYFVFTLPLTLMLMRKVSQKELSKGFVIGLAAVTNFTGFDLLGPTLGAWFESAALLFWIHLGLIFFVLRSRQLLPSRAFGST